MRRRIVDPATGQIVRVVDLKALGFSANAKPHHVVAEPDGSFWYVTLIGDNRT
jgi:streptogramin lyase